MKKEPIKIEDILSYRYPSGLCYSPDGSVLVFEVAGTKEDKSGKPYLLFPAYSSEKSGDTFVSTWVRFLYFPSKDAGSGTLQPDWMKPKGRFTATGSSAGTGVNQDSR